MASAEATLVIGFMKSVRKGKLKFMINLLKVQKVSKKRIQRQKIAHLLPVVEKQSGGKIVA